MNQNNKPPFGISKGAFFISNIFSHDRMFAKTRGAGCKSAPIMEDVVKQGEDKPLPLRNYGVSDGAVVFTSLEVLTSLPSLSLRRASTERVLPRFPSGMV